MAHSIADLLRRAASQRPDHIGMVDGKERLTWRQVLDRSAAMAAHLAGTGIKRGDRVAIYAEHGLGQAIALFAIAMAGGVFTIINPLLKQEQVEHQIKDADVRAVVGTAKHLDAIKGLLRSRDNAALEVSPLGVLLGEVSCGSLAEVRVIPADVACLIYTSGSTGKPKGVIVPHRTLIDGGRIVSGYLGIGRDDTTCSILPLGFDYGLNQLMTATTHAARIVFHRFLLPNEFLSLLAREAITGFAAVPTLWPKLLSSRFAASKPDLSKIRYVTTAGGAHSQTLLRRISEFLPGTEVIVMYGLTESFRSCFLPFAEIFNRPGSIGKPVPEVEIIVVDSNGSVCKPGEVGELYHRGAFVNYGYLNAPELTQQKYIERPVFGPGCRAETIVRSGDLVHMDEEGYLYFHGRVDAQIKAMGFRVSPTEIEEATLTFPGILEPAVVGVADEDAGEAVILYYTTDGHTCVDEYALKAHLVTSLPSYAVPKAFIKLDILPQTPTGKIDYASLKAAWKTTANQ